MFERVIENLLYASRWMLAPIYLGLSTGLVLLGIKFFEEVLHAMPSVLALKETELVLLILSLVDMALVGGLLVMVMLSGYENFISSIDIKDGQENSPGWVSWTPVHLNKKSRPPLWPSLPFICCRPL